MVRVPGNRFRIGQETPARVEIKALDCQGGPATTFVERYRRLQVGIGTNRTHRSQWRPYVWCIVQSASFDDVQNEKGSADFEILGGLGHVGIAAGDLHSLPLLK